MEKDLNGPFRIPRISRRYTMPTGLTTGADPRLQATVQFLPAGTQEPDQGVSISWNPGNFEVPPYDFQACVRRGSEFRNLKQIYKVDKDVYDRLEESRKEAFQEFYQQLCEEAKKSSEEYGQAILDGATKQVDPLLQAEGTPLNGTIKGIPTVNQKSTVLVGDVLYVKRANIVFGNVECSDRDGKKIDTHNAITVDYHPKGDPSTFIRDEVLVDAQKNNKQLFFKAEEGKNPHYHIAAPHRPSIFSRLGGSGRRL